MKKILAFTLAEVLVTLGIIGVVSALTVPTLMRNHQKRVLTTQLHKVYNEFSQAFTSEIAARHAVDLVEARVGSRGAETFLKNHFKVVKDCGSSANGCFASKYMNMDGQTFSYVNNSYYSLKCAVLGSGASVCLGLSSSFPGVIYVDTNGAQGPNVIGRDAFAMHVYRDGTLDRQTMDGCINSDLESCAYDDAKAAREAGREYCRSASWLGAHQCFGVILNDNWEMNY